MRLSSTTDPLITATYDPFPYKYDDQFVTLLTTYTAKLLVIPKQTSSIVTIKSNLTMSGNVDINN
jgi:hypothetical protein